MSNIVGRRNYIIGIDVASGSDRCVVVLHPFMKELDPDYVTELEAMENVELIWQEDLCLAHP